ncbi:hypothetical protein Tco_0218303 [Tanacetum coccineum]
MVRALFLDRKNQTPASATSKKALLLPVLGTLSCVQPPIVQIQSRNPNPEPSVAPVVIPVPKASIPFPSRRNDERRKENANDQNEKF